MLIRKYFVSRRCDGPLVTDPLNLWMRWAIVKKKNNYTATCAVDSRIGHPWSEVLCQTLQV